MSQPAVNPLPWSVVLIFLGIVGVEGIFAVGQAGLVGGPQAVGWRLSAVEDYGFLPSVFDWMLANNRYDLDLVMRLVTYPFVHGSVLSAAMAVMFVLAMGKFVGEATGPIAVLTVFFGSSIISAVLYGVVATVNYPLIGAFTGAYGLIGAYTFILFVTGGQIGRSGIGAFRLIGFLAGVQLVFGLLFGAAPDWSASIFGFVSGFAIMAALQPGGVAYLIAKIRQR